jgi:hypothetical protein
MLVVWDTHQIFRASTIAFRERAGGAGRDVAEIAPGPRGVGHGRVGQEALRLVGAIAAHEGGAFLHGGLKDQERYLVEDRYSQSTRCS